jgi:DNA adenine methylase
MSKFQPIIKWSGSKRSQSDEILKYFPKEIDAYYEPFCGGASILFALLKNENIKVNRYVISDINEDLINLWNMIKEKPLELCEYYSKLWHELNSIEDIEKRKEYYYAVRTRFNKFKCPKDFMFLSRTCANGLIRFNSKGEFNTSFHFSRPGINPDGLKDIVFQWSNLLNKNNVKFICQDYKNINPLKDDLIYLDPPYANTKGMYYGQIDYEEFWTFLSNQKSTYVLSFDGKTGGKDMTYEVPPHIYDLHEYLYNGISGFGKIHKKQEYVSESLYIKYANS